MPLKESSAGETPCRWRNQRLDVPRLQPLRAKVPVAEPVRSLPSFTTGLRTDFGGTDSAVASASKQSGLTTNAAPPILCSQPPAAFGRTL